MTEPIRGLQAYLSRKTKIAQATICLLFSGKRRATPPQAALLEREFISLGISITRWDMLYCPDGTPLLQSAEERAKDELKQSITAKAKGK